MIGRVMRAGLANAALASPAMAAGPVMPGWLAGCWAEQQGPNWTEECWSGPRGGIMLGVGRNGRGEQVKHWEAMQIEQGGDGTLTFYAQPNGGTRVAFPMASTGEREAAIAGGADLAHLARQFSSMVTPFSSVMKNWRMSPSGETEGWKAMPCAVRARSAAS